MPYRPLLIVLLSLAASQTSAQAAADTTRINALLRSAAAMMEEEEWDGARAIYETVLRAAPESSEAAVGAGWAAVMLGAPDAAEAHFRSVSGDPADFGAGRHSRYGLARVVWDRGEREEAVRTLAGAGLFQLGPGTLGPLSEWLGRRDARESLLPWDELRTTLSAMARRDPYDDEVVANLGSMASPLVGPLSPEAEEAAALLDSLRGAAPDSAPVAVANAHALRSSARRTRSRERLDAAKPLYLRALAEYERARALGVPSDDVDPSLAEVYAALGEHREAAALLRAHLARHSDDGYAHLLLHASLWWLGDKEGALRQLALAEENGAFTWNFISCDLDLLRAEATPAEEGVGQSALVEIEACYREELLGHPTQAEAWSGLGRTLMYLGKTEEGRGAFAQAMELAPDSVAYRVGYGWTLFELGQHTEARREYEAAVAQDPSYGPAHYGLFQVAVEEGRSEEAARHALTASRHLPPSADLDRIVGQAHLILGDYALAVTALESARTRDPDDVQALRLLARAHLANGDVEAFERVLESVRGLDPSAAEELLARTAPPPPPPPPPSPLGPGWSYAAESSVFSVWVQVSDPRPIQHEGTSYWVGYVPLEGRERAFSDETRSWVESPRSGRVAKALVRYVFDCGRGRLRTYDTVLYGADGSLIGSANPTYAPWQHPVPGSIGEGIVSAACR